MYDCSAKSSFLHSICNGEPTSLSAQVFRSLAASDVSSTSIIKQCKFLDSVLCSEFSKEFLKNPEVSIRDLKNCILEADFSRSLIAANDHASQSYVAEVANSNAWLRFWDNALDHGVEGTRASLTLLRTLCATLFSDRQCPMDSCDHVIPEATPLCDHLLSHHVSSETEFITPMDLTALVISIASDSDSIASDSDSDPFSVVLSHGSKLAKALHFYHTCML